MPAWRAASGFHEWREPGIVYSSPGRIPPTPRAFGWPRWRPRWFASPRLHGPENCPPPATRVIISDVMLSARIELNDNGNRRTLAIEKEHFTIGRRYDNDLHLGNADVSRYHAEIVLAGDHYSIRDLRSRFG